MVLFHRHYNAISCARKCQKVMIGRIRFGTYLFISVCFSSDLEELEEIENVQLSIIFLALIDAEFDQRKQFS